MVKSCWYTQHALFLIVNGEQYDYVQFMLLACGWGSREYLNHLAHLLCVYAFCMEVFCEPFVVKFLYIKNIKKGTSPWADSVMQNVWVAIIIVKITQDSEAVPYFLNCFLEPTLVCILQEYYYYDIWCIILSQNAVTKIVVCFFSDAGRCCTMLQILS